MASWIFCYYGGFSACCRCTVFLLSEKHSGAWIGTSLVGSSIVQLEGRSNYKTNACFEGWILVGHGWKFLSEGFHPTVDQSGAPCPRVIRRTRWEYYHQSRVPHNFSLDLNNQVVVEVRFQQAVYHWTICCECSLFPALTRRREFQSDPWVQWSSSLHIHEEVKKPYSWTFLDSVRVTPQSIQL